MNEAQKQLLERATAVFGHEDRARTWLERRNPQTGSLSPLELARTPEGAAQVERVLTRLEHGVPPPVPDAPEDETPIREEPGAKP